MLCSKVEYSRLVCSGVQCSKAVTELYFTSCKFIDRKSAVEQPVQSKMLNTLKTSVLGLEQKCQRIARVSFYLSFNKMIFFILPKNLLADML